MAIFRFYSGKVLELREFVREVGPKRLFPIHTEHPELFKELAKRVYELIELGKAYEI